jgi:hypothetical protein
MMKKILMVTAALVALGASPALAEHHEDGGSKKKGGMFQKLDSNSKSEFMERHEKKFEKMDADGNGEISKDEAKSGKQARREKGKERREQRQENSSE